MNSLKVSFVDEDGNEITAEDGLVASLSPPEEVSIDIKPGSDPNCFNINGHGVIPVAILGNSDFDVTSINVESLRFGGLEVRMRGKRGALYSIDDVNAGGTWDLVCHFEDSSANWVPGNSEATLRGFLLDGTEIKGTDSICVVP